MEEKFTWVETYKELAKTLRNYRHRQDELLQFLSELQAEGLSKIATNDKNEKGERIPLSEIDPFTFFANFNRGIRDETRIEIIRLLVEKWQLDCPIPTDFSGIPLVNNQRTWFIAYKKDRGKNDVSLLWTLFEEALDRKIQAETFDAVLKLKYIKNNITMGLFWIAPDEYLNLDSVNRKYLAKHGIETPKNLDFDTYYECILKTRKQFQMPFYMVSKNALDDTTITDESKNKYWLYAPGRKGEYWEEFRNEGIMAIGWDHLGDLSKYTTKNTIVKALRKYDNTPTASKKNDATSCFSFYKEMQVGDIVYAKIGRSKIVGRGIILSDYEFDDSRDYYKHIRRVDWQKKGNWTVSKDNRFAVKTITNVTKYLKFVEYIDSLLKVEKTPQPEITDESKDDVSYWWLNANPKIWDFEATSPGTVQTYTSHNSKGNKRRVYKYFQEIKPGDLIIGYVASPVQQIAALCKVTKPLHNTAEGEGFEFEKVEQFLEPISLNKLQNVPELKNCEPLINRQGSLFHLTSDEYDTILSIVEEQQPPKPKTNPIYSIEQCAKETGFSIDRIKKWLAAIERKGQVVFYGPPGTGKTFIANHIARHIVGGSNGFVELIQFHPAYAYEDFMQGIRPDADDKGNLTFELKPGQFLSLCKRAEYTDSPCVLIIDEINRANLSRVFGELMYLLEYRDKKIPLAGGAEFSIPPNVRIIGTMNTADRSIALVDFALRRRFAFIELYPDYDLLTQFQEKKGFNVQGLVSLLREVNTKINDKNFSLGITFFMVENLPDKIEQIWRMEIETYLEEFFFSQQNTVETFRWDKIKERILQRD